MAIVNSYGGSATTIFIEHFKKHGIDIPIKSGNGHVYKHASSPPEACDKAVYIFSDPVNAVMSFFRRKSEGWNKEMRGKGEVEKDWVVKHCKNIGGEHLKMSEEWGLTDYLSQGEELFKLERHFDNWTRADRPYPILLVKYEKMWENLELIHNFMHRDQSTISDFPQKIARGSSLGNLSRKDRYNILKMYGPLKEKISLAPDISETPPQ